MFDVVFGAAWTIFAPASWCWPLPAKAMLRHLAVRPLAHQVDARVLHRQLGAEVAVDPLDRRVGLGDRALGHEVVDVLRPVLHGRVADPRARLGDQLDDGGVQRVRAPHRGGAALDVVHVGALVGDDQRPLELAHVLGVDPEVGLQRHLDVHARGHVDERAARPDRGVQRRELVVVGRDDRREVLADELPCSRRPESMSRKMTPCFSRSSRTCGRRPRTRTGRRRRPGTSLGLGDAQAVERVS